MSEQNQEVQPGDVTAELPIEDPAGEGPEGEGEANSLKDFLASGNEKRESDGVERMIEFLEMVGLRPPDYINLRKAEPFHDVDFRGFVLGTETLAPGFESFPGDQFETKLNEAAEQKLSLDLQYRCPNNLRGGDCNEPWHKYAVIVNGEEYVYWFLAAKMARDSGIWLDEREVDDEGRISQNRGEQSTGAEAGTEANSVSSGS